MNTEKADPDQLEGRIAAWRAQVVGASDPDGAALEDLEQSLSGQFDALRQTGLDADEAFLIALKRVGERHAPTAEFLGEYARRVLNREEPHPPGAPTGGLAGTQRRETLVVFGLAALAAAAIRLPELFGFPLADGGGVYVRNLSLFVFPCLAGYFGWKRRLEAPSAIRVGLAFVAAAVLVNAFPFAPEGATESLAALHLPIALWMAVGVAYAGGRWNSTSHRLKFVRFSGELFIHCVLIGLGGVVLIGLTMMTFRAIGVDAERLVEEWVLPSGALGAIVVSGWLADTKANVAGNMAPMLTRIFTPLFAAVLITFLLTMAWAGTGIRMEREVLIGFDLLLVVVVGLVLYAVAAHNPRRPARRLRWPPARPCDFRARRGRAGARSDRRPDLRVRLHRQPDRGPRRKPDPVRQPCRIGLAHPPVSPKARFGRRARTLADRLPAGVCRLGGGSRRPVSTAVRLPLAAGRQRGQ